MYSSWAEKRKKRITYFVGGTVVLLVSLYVYIGMYELPTCFDLKKNQDELGVDCGGSCSLRCPFEVQDVQVLWSRAFSAGSLWNTLIYIENPNRGVEAYKVPYQVTFYDINGVVIKEVKEESFMSDSAINPIFLGRIDLGDAKPYRVSFSFTEPLLWHAVRDAHDIALEEQRILNTASAPEVQAVFNNKEPYALKNVEVYAIIYDDKDNAIAVSKTFIDSIPARTKRKIFFTWSEPFKGTMNRWQLVPKIPVQEE